MLQIKFDFNWPTGLMIFMFESVHRRITYTRECQQVDKPEDQWSCNCSPFHRCQNDNFQIKNCDIFVFAQNMCKDTSRANQYILKLCPNSLQTGSDQPLHNVIVLLKSMLCIQQTCDHVRFNCQRLNDIFKCTLPPTSKRDDFYFDIVNFPFLDGDVPRRPSYGVYISQLIRFARVCSHVDDFNTRNKCLTA